MNRYDAKYFGIASGILSVIIFLLALIKSFYTDAVITYLRPFIPFYSETNFLNAVGGIVVAFIWGFVLGYFLILTYNFFDQKFSRSLK